jgi:hypothetical protein
MESRSDPMLSDSSDDGQFSRDSNYVLEEYHLYDDELGTVIERDEENPN